MKSGSMNTTIPRFETTPTRQPINHHQHHQQAQQRSDSTKFRISTRAAARGHHRGEAQTSGYQQVTGELICDRGQKQLTSSGLCGKNREIESQGPLNLFSNLNFSVGQSKRMDSCVRHISTYTPFGISTTESSSTTGSRETDKRFIHGDSPQAKQAFGRVFVDLIRGKEDSLGLTVSGGTEQGEPPQIACIRPGSIADRSDSLLVSDRILSINNTSGSKLRHDENVRFSKSAGLIIRMEVEYELPDLPPAGCTVKHMLVNLEARTTGIGLVIRGGWSKLASHVRPLTVMHVRSNSAADWDGHIKPGDRILSINNIQTGQLTCEEANRLVSGSKPQLSLVVEYNVANFDADRSISGAVIVEIEKPGNEDLGVSLAPCHEVRSGQNAFFINFIRQGSIADRCGALFTGDRVEAIDGVHVEQLTLQGAMHRLKHNGLNTVRLQIVPNAIIEPERSTKVGTGRKKVTRTSQSSCPFAPGVLGDSISSKSVKDQARVTSGDSKYLPPLMALATFPGDPCPSEKTVPSSGYNVEAPRPQNESFRCHEHSAVKAPASLRPLVPVSLDICRCEEVVVCIAPDDVRGYGFRLRSPTRDHHTPHAKSTNHPLICHVEPGGVAYRSGVLQEGDRVLALNGQSTKNLSATSLTAEFLQPSVGGKPPTLTMLTEYSIADTVVPASGVFDVKLVRRTANLGINLQASVRRKDGQPLLISKVIPGSVARRSGSISPGDTLLAVNGISLASCSLAQAIRLLQSPDEEIVILRIEKKLSSLSDLTKLEDIMTQSNPDASTKNQNESRYRRGTSLPETDFYALNNLQGHVGSSSGNPQTSLEYEYNTFENVESKILHKELRETSFHTMDKTGRKKELDQHSGSQRYNTMPMRSEQTPGDRSTSSGQDEIEPRFSTKLSEKATKTVRPHTANQTPTFDGKDSQWVASVNASAAAETSPEDRSQSDELRVVRIVLKRKSAECPWGIIICGTDEASNAPVVVDSLSPDSPSAASGLLHPGDRLLAINGSVLHAGHTLSQAMRMLQQHPDKVVLHLARPAGSKAVETDRIAGSSGTEEKLSLREHAGGATSDFRVKAELDDPKIEEPEYQPDNDKKVGRYVPLKKVSSMGNFSRSFDSITNSINSGTRTTAASVTVPLRQSRLDSSGTVKADNGTRVPRPRSVGSFQPNASQSLTKPQSFLSRGPTDLKKIPVYNQVEYGSRMVEHFPTVSVHHEDLTPDLVDAGNFVHTERNSECEHWINTLNQAKRGNTSITHPTRYTQELSYSDDGGEGSYIHRSSDTSDALEALTVDPPGSSFFPEVNYSDMTERDLEAIQCPGCREAILHERQQQKLNKTDQYAVKAADKLFWGDFAHRRSEFYPGYKRDANNPRRRARSFHHEEQTQVPKVQTEQPYLYKDKNQPCQHSCYSEAQFRLWDQCNPTKVYPQNRRPCHGTPQTMFHDYRELVHPQPAGTLQNTFAPFPTVRHSRSDSGLNLAGILSPPDVQVECLDNHSNLSKVPSRTTAPQSPQRTKVGRQAMSHHSNMPCHLESVFPQRSFRYENDQKLMFELASGGQMQSRLRNHPLEHNWSIHSVENSAENHDRSTKSRQESIGQCELWCQWIRLMKASSNDAYGIGVSEGLSTRGVFISAIRPGSPADRSKQLNLYDRILMVNDIPVEGHSCSEIVGYVSSSEKIVDLLIQRRIPRQRIFNREENKAISGTDPQHEEIKRLQQRTLTTMTKRSPGKSPQLNLTSL